tara:strand:- start:169 stop:474 length:306 start_codon:yes stop_codon:yes gene_type:complete
MKNTYQMYFGRNLPTGEYITDDVWESFREVLSMTFAGYTIQDVQGAWKGVPEDTKLVTVTTKYKDKVNDVCQAYVNIFNQDAVGLLISEPMTFVTKQSEIY